jgi:hypothetical protein
MMCMRAAVTAHRVGPVVKQPEKKGRCAKQALAGGVSLWRRDDGRALVLTGVGGATAGSGEW